jgi:hypothetical protein
MASGAAFKLPKKVGNQITQEYRYKDESGSLVSGQKVIIDTDDVDWAESVGQEIMNLLASGELVLPDAAAGSISLRRESLTEQMESDKYIYQLSAAAKTGKFMVYLNGLNVTLDVELSEDGGSFTFNSEYSGDMFGEYGATIFVDYIEAE